MKLRLSYIKTPRAMRGHEAGTALGTPTDMLIVMPGAGGKACARLRGGSTRQRRRAARLLRYGIAQGCHAPERKHIIGRLSRFC